MPNNKPKWRRIKLKNRRVFSATTDEGLLLLTFVMLIPVKEREYYKLATENKMQRFIKRRGVPVIQVVNICMQKELAAAVMQLIGHELCC